MVFPRRRLKRLLPKTAVRNVARRACSTDDTGERLLRKLCLPRDDETRILIDAGSATPDPTALISIGRTPESLSGILLTHEHSDHIRFGGPRTRLQIPVYCNRLTGRRRASTQAATQQPSLGTGPFEIGDVSVDTFAVPHDAHDQSVSCFGRRRQYRVSDRPAYKLVVERVEAQTS